MLHSVSLDDMRVIAVSGPDRMTFLQGQLTQDVTLARPDTTLLAGWADAKGRLLCVGHLFVLDAGSDEALAFLVPQDLAEMIARRLRMYVLRAKAQVTLADLGISGLLGDAAANVRTPGCQRVQVLNDPSRQLLLGPRGDVLAAGSGTRVELAAWHLADVRAGIPRIIATTSGEFVPQMVNLELVGGISFTKGCYTGQEIVARTKYLGRVKRRMLRFSTTGVPPAPGAPVFAARGASGQVVLSAPAASGSELLAVIYLDDLPGPFFLDAGEVQALRRLELPYLVPELAG